MHSTGEKTNPGPLGRFIISFLRHARLNRHAEKILMTDPHVSGAIMFGRGRFNVGVLIAPAEEFAFDPRDEKKLSEYRNLIW